MSRRSPRIARTEVDVLVSNLRGEVGEAITTWLILRHLKGVASTLRSNEPGQDLSNQELTYVSILIDKLRDELIARLAELGDERIGRTNFYFASRKLEKLATEASKFSRFVVTKQLTQKRNNEIAHREQPERWFEDSPIRIRYATLVKATGMAVRMMKKIDRAVLGPAAPFLWREARRRRGTLMASPKVMYLLLPHLALSGKDCEEIAKIERAEGNICGPTKTQ